MRAAGHRCAVLHQRDRFGRDTQYIDIHRLPQLEKPFGEFGIHAMRCARAFWAGRKYPSWQNTPLRFLFNQAEFGLGCPIMSPTAAQLLANFGSDARRPNTSMASRKGMSKLTQGGQFMTEKEGGSDVGKLTHGVQDGEQVAPVGEKMVLLQSDAEWCCCWRAARREGGTAGGLLPDASPSRRRIAKPLPDRPPQGQVGTPRGSGEIKLEGAFLCGRKLDRASCNGRDGDSSGFQRRQIHPLMRRHITTR